MGPKLATPLDLAGYRAGKGLSLQQVARATQITPRYLEAIERGAFEKLPGGINDINYIRQYAKAVEYDQFALVDRYLEVSTDFESD